MRKAKLIVWIPDPDGNEFGKKCEVEGSNEAVTEIRNLIIRLGRKAHSIGIPAMSASFSYGGKE